MAKETLAHFAREIETAAGPRLIAFLLYGSLAREPEGMPAADINTLLVADTVDDALFASLEPAVRSWVRAGHPAPLVFAAAEWRESADAFAIEYEEMRHAHRVLAGRDPFGEVTVGREDLRRQLETELRGKLVRLRQAYAATRSDPRALSAALAASASGLLTMLRTLLRLSGATVPDRTEDVVRAAAALVGFPPAVLDDWVGHLRGRRLRLAPHDPRAVAYLDVLAQTAEFVDRLT